MSKNKSPITKHPKLHITQKPNKTPNVKNRPKTKHPNYKTSKITKSPNLQYVQSYKMFKVKKCPKLQNVQGYKILVTCILNILYLSILVIGIFNLFCLKIKIPVFKF